MKRTILLFVILLPVEVSPQVNFTDSVKYALRNHLYQNVDALDSLSINDPNLRIWSLIYYEGQIKESGSVDIIGFKDASPHNYIHVLLVWKNKSQIINLRQEYDAVIEDVLEFFRMNPEVDKRFLPLCIRTVSSRYLYNTGHHQNGPWYTWWNQTDTLAQQLNVQWREWVN